ncbi:MAG: nickel pincer cofactor biosynthesis protein LarC [Pirellulales bacterium]
MKIAYFDCASGISGDMTLGALVDAGADLETIQAGIDSLGLPSCRLVREEVKKHGFRATQIRVEHEPEHAHRHLHHITDMIRASRLSERQQALAERIFTRLGEAEAKVHGTTIQKVHFHEVGAVDSIADICGAAIAWDLLGAERLVCSPVVTGHGYVEIAHGRCAIPAPATAELLRGIPLVGGEVDAELTTPTGAAIVAALADGFGPPPAMSIETIGCGAGQRDLAEQANLLRVFLGEATGDAVHTSEPLWMVETNIDDASGETIAYAAEQLMAAGALDVTTVAIQMKKNRPGVLIQVLCQPAFVERAEAILFAETTTLGVRRWPVQRRSLRREPHTVETALGGIAGKLAWLDETTCRFSPEYEACRQIAQQQNRPLQEVMQLAVAAFAARPPSVSARS